MDGLDVVDRAVINGLQGGFPLDPRPFRTAGEALGLSEHELIARLRRLLEQGKLSRYLVERASARSVPATMSRRRGLRRLAGEGSLERRV